MEARSNGEVLEESGEILIYRKDVVRLVSNHEYSKVIGTLI